MALFEFNSIYTDLYTVYRDSVLKTSANIKHLFACISYWAYRFFSIQVFIAQ